MKRPLRTLLLGNLLLGLFLGTAAAETYTFTSLDVPGSTSTVAEGINNVGQIVGYYSLDGRSHGFLRNLDGSYVTIDPAGAANITATGINDAGQVVGYATIPGQSYYQGFIRAADGSFTYFNIPGLNTFAEGINNSGQVSGYAVYQGNDYAGFIRSASGMTTTSQGYELFGINDSGQTIMSYPNNAYSSIRNADGSMTSLPAGYYYDINNLGRSSGFTFGPDGRTVPIVVNADLTTTTTLIIPGAYDGTGFSSFARGLNDSGLVVGTYADSSGKRVGFLATPNAVPEPASLVMLGVGVLAVAASRRRSRPISA